MSKKLQDYNKKRNFKETSEPEGKLLAPRSSKGGVGDVTGKFRFVIQKHAATRLHFDFRIELDGVLVSWAVPKGLPFKSAERHLAMHVEDHPVSYYDFEGNIPEGNYGAGNVIVWDWGNYWVPHAEDEKDVEKKLKAGIKKGEVKLILNGEKVKGMFALVRFKRAGDDAWLFIKDKDEFEGKDFTQKNKSVKSGKTLEELEEEHQEKPEFISPMKATLGEKAFDSQEYIFEEKFDGYRIIAVLNKKKVDIFSRNGKNYNKKFPEIVEELKKYNIKAVLDGEVVAFDKKGNQDFHLINKEENRADLKYFVFDILNFNGTPTIELPLTERKKILKKVVKNTKAIKRTKTTKGKGKALFKKVKGEGIIAKKVDSKYVPDSRSSEWVKIKNTLREDFIIGGVTKPKGQRSGFGALLLGYYKKDKFIYVGRVGTGFDEKLIKALAKTLKKIEVKNSPFEDFDVKKDIQFWVKPVVTIEAEFRGWTPEKMLRQASFIGIRTDKLPQQVNNEYSMMDKILSHPEKVYFPQKKYTKLDLAQYYKEISPILLPYLKDRPQNLNRFPEGIDGHSFYHKDMEFELPDYVKTIDIKRDDPKEDKNGKLDKEITYMLCQNVESLIYMVNLGCLEINPWLSTIDNLANPDYIVFDIDPDKTDWKEVTKIARELYNFLEEIELPTFIKTSGKRGIHLYGYLGKKNSYEDSRNFVKLIGTMLESKYPKIVSMERSPKDRKGKIYMDYLQNRDGQTTASVYSARPTKEATVSMPIKITELTARLDPTKFTIKNALKRVEKSGDLWDGIKKKKVSLKKSLKLLKEIGD